MVTENIEFNTNSYKMPEKNHKVFENEEIGDINKIEKNIEKQLPIDEIIKIFGNDTYLIGGAVRDVILGKNFSDFDLMTRTPIEVIKDNLRSLGFTESKDHKFMDGKYQIKDEVGVFNLIIQGKEIQVASIGNKTIEELISTADINLNCCAFSLSSRKIINSNILKEILNKELKFLNPELALQDPMKIISALKQISRIPDLKISEETSKTIYQAIPVVFDFFKKNPLKRHKLKSLLGNINTKQVLDFFNGFNMQDILEGLSMKRSKLKVSPEYFSSTVKELDLEIKTKLSIFVASQFGKRFDRDKLFNNKINSVAYELDNMGNVVCCCLIDGDRLYATSSTSSEKIVKLVSDLCKNNYNIWSTISITSTHLINLCPKAGLHIIESKELIEKVLTNNYPEYKGKLIISNHRGHMAFSKENSKDSPQVLVMS